jgi:hypothetical protein
MTYIIENPVNTIIHGISVGTILMGIGLFLVLYSYLLPSKDGFSIGIDLTIVGLLVAISLTVFYFLIKKNHLE